MSAPLLAARGLSVDIGGHQVVRGLDLDIAAGQRLAILGRNGAGKSTLLATLAGLHQPSAGRVDLGGCHHVGQPGIDTIWVGRHQLLSDLACLGDQVGVGQDAQQPQGGASTGLRGPQDVALAALL